MNVSVDNLALNKSGTKVKIIGKPKYFNLYGTLIQWGPVIGWIAYSFGVFSKDGNSVYRITGGGVMIIVILYLIFRQKIQDALLQAEEQYSARWKRVKNASVALMVAGILIATYFISYTLAVIIGIYGLSSLGSLYFYLPYDEINLKRIEMQKLLKEKNKEKDFELLSQRYEALQSQKTI